MIINTMDDLHSYISDQFSRIDLSCYENDFDFLVMSATIDYMNYLIEYCSFKFGDELPENDLDIFELIKDL